LGEATTSKIVSEKEAEQTQAAPRLLLRLQSGLQNEGRLWQKTFTAPGLYILLFGALLAFTLAWQTGFNYKINPASNFRLDEPFFQNFNSREETTGSDKFTYRWTRGESALEFKGLGKRDYGLRLRLQPGQNNNPNLGLTVFANETLIGNYKIEPGPKDYDFTVPASAITGTKGDLRLVLKTTPFQAGNDPRELGLVFMSAEVQARPTTFTLPPVTQLGYLLATVLLTYLIVTRAGFGGWVGAGVGGMVAAILAYGIATPARPWLTVFTQELTFAFGLSLLALVLLDIPLRRVWEQNWERAWVLSIFGLALAIRLAGAFHPFMQMVDIGFHNNRYLLFWEQGQYFQKIESQEWGGRLTYYPTAMYAVIGLFRWLVPDTILLLKIWMVLFDTTRVLLIFYLVKRAVGDGRAAVLSAFFMVTTPVALLSIGYGQVSNLYGEWLLLVGLCLLVVKYDQLRRWPYFVTLTAVLLASFLQHPGIIILSGAAFLLIIILLALRRENRKGAKFAFAAYFLALALSIALYHYATIADMLPQAFSTLGNKVSGAAAPNGKCVGGIQVGGSVDDRRLGLIQKCVKTPGEWFSGGLAGFLAEARVYFNLIPLLMLPWTLYWLWRTGRKGSEPIEPDDNDELRIARRRVFWAGIAWIMVAVFYALLGWTLNLYVRYSLFLLPFAAIGAGVFLARLWKRHEWAGKLLTLAISAYFLVTILALWYDRIIFRSTELRP